MAYSYMTLVSDGTLKSAPITFTYMKVEDIVVHQNLRKLTSGIDYTITNNVITFKNVIPALDKISVDRMSQRDSLRVKFVEGATFSRENMDDALTQMLYLTQEAMEGSVDRISPTGVLDLAGNRIINLGDPIELTDAVPLHIVVDAENSVYASEANCKKYRDEALAYRNSASTYATNAKNSETAAKNSETNAKASETNALASKNAAATSATNAKNSENAALASKNAAAASEAKAKGYADSSEAIYNTVVDAVQENGSVPIGTIAMVAHNTATPPVGWLFCGTTFNTTAYPALARLFPNGEIPDFTDRFPRGVGATAIGAHGAQAYPAHSHSVSVSGTTSSNGSYSGNVSTLAAATVSTTSVGDHEHGTYVALNRYVSASNGNYFTANQYTGGAMTDPAGAHTHSVTVPSHSHTFSVPSHTHTFSYSGDSGIAGSGNLVLPNHIGVRYIIKAYEGVADKDAALVIVGQYDARVADLESKVAGVVNGHVRKDFTVPPDPSGALEERYLLCTVADGTGVVEAIFYTSNHIKGKVVISSGYTNKQGRIDVYGFYNQTVNGSERRIHGIGIDENGGVWVHAHKATAAALHAWTFKSIGGVSISSTLQMCSSVGAKYEDYVGLELKTPSMTRFSMPIYERNARVFSPNNPPTAYEVKAQPLIVNPDVLLDTTNYLTSATTYRYRDADYLSRLQAHVGTITSTIEPETTEEGVATLEEAQVVEETVLDTQGAVLDLFKIVHDLQARIKELEARIEP